eukprot:1795534-Rhodomonas_salina.3
MQLTWRVQQREIKGDSAQAQYSFYEVVLFRRGRRIVLIAPYAISVPDIAYSTAGVHSARVVLGQYAVQERGSSTKTGTHAAVAQHTRLYYCSDTRP